MRKIETTSFILTVILVGCSPIAPSVGKGVLPMGPETVPLEDRDKEKAANQSKPASANPGAELPVFLVKELPNEVHSDPDLEPIEKDLSQTESLFILEKDASKKDDKKDDKDKKDKKERIVRLNEEFEDLIEKGSVELEFSGAQIAAIRVRTEFEEPKDATEIDAIKAFDLEISIKKTEKGVIVTLTDNDLLPSAIDLRKKINRVGLILNGEPEFVVPKKN